jgi:hypothetical protein
VGAADAADRGEGDAAAGEAEEKAGERSSGSRIGQQGTDGRIVTVIKDHDGQTDGYKEGGAYRFRQIDVKEFVSHYTGNKTPLEPLAIVLNGRQQNHRRKEFSLVTTGRRPA